MKFPEFSLMKKMYKAAFTKTPEYPTWGLGGGGGGGRCKPPAKNFENGTSQSDSEAF